MNCPGCGAPIGEGKAYCSNPSCGAAAPVPGNKTVLDKKVELKITFDFALIARLAAALIALLAGAWLYFFAKP